MLKHGRRLKLLTSGRRFRGHGALVQDRLTLGLWPFPVTAPSCIDAVMAFASDWPRPSGRESVSKPGQDEFWQIYEDLWIVDAFLWQVWKRTESIFCKPRCCSHSLSHIRLFVTPRTVAHHGIVQARILEGAAIASSRGSFQHRAQICISYVSCIGRWILYHWPTDTL